MYSSSPHAGLLLSPAFGGDLDDLVWLLRAKLPFYFSK